MIEKIQMQKI